MAQVFLLTYGSHGDINPFIGLGLALKQRGHNPRLITNEYYEQDARAAGIDFVAHSDKKRFLEISSHADSLSPHKAVTVLLPFIMEAVRTSYRYIEQRYKPGDTVTVEHIGLSAGLLAQDKLGIPSVAVALSPMNMYSIHSPARSQGLNIPKWTGIWGARLGRGMLCFALGKICNPSINRLRDELGIPRIASFMEWRYKSPRRVACAWPEWLYSAQRDWPMNAVTTGFVDYDGSAGETLQSPIASYQSEGPIVFTAGSATSPAAAVQQTKKPGTWDLRAFFATAVKVCGILNRQGIMLTRRVEHLPRDLPANVSHLSYAPSLRELLSRSCAVVHHGGIGTLAYGLRAGIPQLITPTIYDQFDNAARLSGIGVADYITERPLSAVIVADRLQKLLESRSVMERCRHFAAQMRMSDACEMTCELIESARLS